MPEFNTTLTNSGITISGLSYSNGTLTISDYSNYIASTESGHLQANFSDYKIITVINPDDEEYVFSTIAGGDETILAPSTYGASPVTHTYTYTDDGLYKIKLITLPTWDNTATYQQYDCVYYLGSLYKALQTSSNNNPATATTYWELIVDVETELPEKYYYIGGIAILDDTKEYLAELIYTSNLEIDSRCDGSELCKNDNWRKATRIDNMIQVLENGLLNANVKDFELAEDVFERLNNLCECI